MLTKAEIEAIRERAVKASEGPWQLADTYDGPWVLDSDDDIITGTVSRIDDADFIANAREDIPKLLAEIERLDNIVAWNVSCVVCVNQLGERWKYDDNYGELICEECYENRYGGDNE